MEDERTTERIVLEMARGAPVIREVREELKALGMTQEKLEEHLRERAGDSP